MEAHSSQHSPQNDVKIIAIGILLVVLVGVYFFGRTLWQDKQRQESDYQSLVGKSQEQDYPTITPESFQKMMGTPSEKFTLIDIRSREAYTLSHIPNALSYPDASINTINLPVTNKIIVVGNETDEQLNNEVADYLNSKGYNFAFIKGGHSAWTNLNNQVVTTGDPSSFVDQSKIKYITTEDLKKRFQANEKIFVLDVQPKEGFAKKHLKDAKNIPVSELENRIAELPGGQKIVVYGTNEAEAFRAGVILFDLNIFGAEVVSGDQVLDSGLFTEGQ